MAGSTSGPELEDGTAAERERSSFDVVLVAARADERARLLRHRRRWIAQQLAVIAAALAVLAVSVPRLFDPNHGRGASFALAVFLTGGWLGYVALMASASGAVLATVLAVGRIGGVLRAEDLADHERTHEPWWGAFRN